MFEHMFIEASLNPDDIEASVDHTVAEIRAEIEQVRDSSAIYGISEEPDLQTAERLRSHPLPHWVEQMTVSYLKSHGGAAIRKRSWWDLHWPDGQEHPKAVFNVREADHLTGATLLNLEEARIRGLALNLPQLVAGQPLPCVSVDDLPAAITGFWGLFEVRLQAGMYQKARLLRIPMVRRGYISVFLSDEGKLFCPRPGISGMHCRPRNLLCTIRLEKMNPLLPMNDCNVRQKRPAGSCLMPCNKHMLTP